MPTEKTKARFFDPMLLLATNSLRENNHWGMVTRAVARSVVDYQTRSGGHGVGAQCARGRKRRSGGGRGNEERETEGKS
jgi:hypothetical protein